MQALTRLECRHIPRFRGCNSERSRQKTMDFKGVSAQRVSSCSSYVGSTAPTRSFTNLQTKGDAEGSTDMSTPSVCWQTCGPCKIQRSHHMHLWKNEGPGPPGKPNLVLSSSHADTSQVRFLQSRSVETQYPGFHKVRTREYFSFRRPINMCGIFSGREAVPELRSQLDALPPARQPATVDHAIRTV